MFRVSCAVMEARGSTAKLASVSRKVDLSSGGLRSSSYNCVQQCTAITNLVEILTGSEALQFELPAWDGASAAYEVLTEVLAAS